MSDEGDILGASLRIPICRDPATFDADAGWFFIANNLPAPLKVRVADAMADLAHTLMRAAGFTRCVTNMGTKAGARLLSARYGYIFAPDAANNNRWVKIL
jgi:hypothetical protein